MMLFPVILRVSKCGHPIQAIGASSRWTSTMATAAVAQNMLPKVMNKDGSLRGPRGLRRNEPGPYEGEQIR